MMHPTFQNPKSACVCMCMCVHDVYATAPKMLITLTHMQPSC